MTNIATFGCSFTAGVGLDYFNWAKELACQNPSIQIDNYSLGGTSVKWSVSQMMACKKRNMKNTAVVFQIASPFRITLADQRIDYKSSRQKLTTNYTDYTVALYNEILHFNIGYPGQTTHAHFSKEDVVATHDVLFAALDIDIELFEWEMYIDSATEQADFTYFQLIRDQEQYFDMSGKKLPCVQEYMGIKQYKAWVYDDGEHLNAEGSQEVAKWVKSHLTL
jgi:hypothetical protein